MRIDFVSSVMLRRSLPAISGADSMHQRLMWVRYSSAVIPPLPTSSISGSFQCPVLVYGEISIWAKPIRSMESQRSPISISPRIPGRGDIDLGEADTLHGTYRLRPDRY